MITADAAPSAYIERRIFLMRGQKVMLDFHLAELYGTQTKVLIQAVKRNLQRFPPEFMFQLGGEEYQSLRSQFVTSKRGRGGRRYLPYAFTEHGVAMLSSVLNSERAITINIMIIKTFVRLREFLSTHKALAQKLSELEGRVGEHDREIRTLFEAIRQLMQPEDKPKRQIGFRVEEPRIGYRLKRKKS
jgi:phage regulator Rha-like protein